MPTGQLVTGSFQDYAMPRADDLPELVSELTEVPAKTNPLGVKGAGEAGATGAPPAIIGAILDALKPLGIEHIDMPATPSRVWAAIKARESKIAAAIVANESAPNLFADGKAYERLMGRWSRLAGEKFLDWLDAAEKSAMARRRLRQWRLHRSADRAVRAGRGHRRRSVRRPARLCAHAGRAQSWRNSASPTRRRCRLPTSSFDAAAMALVIVFIPDPAKAAREMARVVRPGGSVATYMWDFPDGFPLAPLGRGDEGSSAWRRRERPNVEASRRDAMRAIWQAGRAQRDRERGDPHSRRLFQLRRFLGIRTPCRSVRPAKRLRILPRARASN